MAVAALDRRAGFEIDAERRAEQRQLGVVDGERVAGEQHVDPAAADQLGEVRRAAGVDDDRAGDEDDAAAGRPRFAHQRGDAADAGLDAALRRDLVGHEREVRAVALAELRGDADAFQAADHAIAGPDLAQLAARRRGRRRRRSRRPCAGARPRSTRRRRARGCACWSSNRSRRARSRRARRSRSSASCSSTGLQPSCIRSSTSRRSAGRRRRRHLQRNARELVVGAADGEVQHLERAAALDHLVEDRVENVRVDQMAFGADHRRMCASVLHD